MHLREIAALCVQGLQARQVGRYHLAVPIEGKDQGDVDAAPLGDHGLDRRHPRRCCGDFDQQVRLRDPLMEVASCGDGCGCVMCDLRRHLDGREAVGAVALVIDGPEQAERAVDVVDDEFPVGVGDALAGGYEGRELLVIGGGPLDRSSKYGGVGCETAHAVGYVPRKRPVAQVGAAEVVEPWTLTLLGEQPLKFGHLGPLSGIPPSGGYLTRPGTLRY